MDQHQKQIVIFYLKLHQLIWLNRSDLYLSKGLNDLTKLTDEALNKKLLSIFGVGPWSVNMFEIFCVGKLNVFSSKDAGLRQAMNNYGFVKYESNWVEYDKYAEKWSPYD